MKIAVIGGGASGQMAALTAAGSGAETVILEAGTVPGRKILSTGNGRCNLTNLALDPALYQGSCRRHASLLLREFGVQDTLDFFDGIGIPTVAAGSARGNDAWVYPSCREASAVRMALEMECERRNVRIRKEARAVSLKKQTGRFLIGLENGSAEEADRVILTTGGKAFPKSGSDGSGYALAASFGHQIVTPLPALGPVISSSPYTKNLSGLRAEALLSLQADDTEIAREYGEVQFTDYGLSGIPVFQLSGRIARELAADHRVTLVLDLLPDKTEQDIRMDLAERKLRRRDRESGTLLLGLVPSKMVPVLFQESGIPLHVPCREISQNGLTRLAELLTAFAFPIGGVKDFDACQVTSGGIPATEVSLNLESIKCVGLYFAGEILDLDGPCGGYNLQWAWTSGYAAGKAAAKTAE
ncbi:MAG: aminoacetone oxidase family FAD-binding enzyme [Lachnospiraceae bacterium]|nr:aminoacetone oxidase family FAD-binding enzyme [Lachnospiraceae bacterium]